MKNKHICYLILVFFALMACTTVSKKVDDTVKEEEIKLSKFLKKSESELKIEFGKPDLIEVSSNTNKILIYYETKFRIKCERRFEIGKSQKVIGFSSKNCF